MEEQFRPKAKSGKIHSKDEFELCYLRHQYLRRTTRNPGISEMAPYQKIIKTQAHNTYFTYKNLFGAIGFDVEDIMSVGQVQLVSYLGLFAVQSSEQRSNDFDELFKERNGVLPTTKNIKDKNLATFTLFLKQRMEDLVRICRQKARNIKGTITDEYQIFYGPNEPGRDARELMENYSEMGYRKMDLSAFRTIRKKSGQKNSVFKFNGVWYICVPVRHSILTIDDLDGAGMHPADSIHNMNPEQIFLQIEDNREFESKKSKFESLDPKERAKIVREFVMKNRLNTTLASELDTARKMLSTLEKM